MKSSQADLRYKDLLLLIENNVTPSWGPIMKYLDYAAFGAASGAYAEAARAQDGMNQLWNEMQRLPSDINSLEI
jgi:hypothetical protein